MDPSKGRRRKRDPDDTPVQKRATGTFLSENEERCRNHLEVLADARDSWEGDGFYQTQFRPFGGPENDKIGLETERKIYEMFGNLFKNKDGFFLIHSLVSSRLSKAEVDEEKTEDKWKWPEIDVFIISRKYPLIHVEVKSSPRQTNEKDKEVMLLLDRPFAYHPESYSCPRAKFLKDSVKKRKNSILLALDDRQKILQFVKEMAQDVSDVLKPNLDELDDITANAIGIAALPNAPVESIDRCQKKNICNCSEDQINKYFDRYRTILMEDVIDENSFSQWWHNLTSKIEERNISLETYRFLLRCFVLGPYTVSFNEVTDTLGASIFRILGSSPDDSKPENRILDIFKGPDTFMYFFLHPTQRQVSRGQGNGWISGPAGCGKTWVMQFQVKQLLKEILSSSLDDKVLVLTYNRTISRSLAVCFMEDRLLKSCFYDKLIVYCPQEREKCLEEKNYTKLKETRKHAQLWCLNIDSLLADMSYHYNKDEYDGYNNRLSKRQKIRFMKELVDNDAVWKKQTFLPKGGFQHIFWDEAQDIEGPFFELGQKMLSRQALESEEKSWHHFVFYDSYQAAQGGHDRRISEYILKREQDEKYQLVYVFRQTKALHSFAKKFLGRMAAPEPETKYAKDFRADGVEPKFWTIPDQNKMRGRLADPMRAAREVRCAIEKVLKNYKNDPWFDSKSVSPTSKEHRTIDMIASEICVITTNEKMANQLAESLHHLLKNEPIIVDEKEGYMIKGIVSGENAMRRDGFTVVVESWRRFKGMEAVVVIWYDPPVEEAMIENPQCRELNCSRNEIERHKYQVELMYYCVASRAICYLVILTVEEAIEGFRKSAPHEYFAKGVKGRLDSG